MFPMLETERLVLREISKVDAEEFFLHFPMMMSYVIMDKKKLMVLKRQKKS